jgi:hypothetical protein
MVISPKRHSSRQQYLYVLFLHSKSRAFISMVTSAMFTCRNPSLSKAEWSRYCIHLRIINFLLFGMFAATGWKIWRQGHLQCRHFKKTSSKSTKRFKSCTHLRSLNIRHFGMIEVTFNVITSIQNFNQIHQSVQKLHPPLIFKRRPFRNGLRYGIRNYGNEVTFSIITSIHNVIKIHHSVQKLHLPQKFKHRPIGML